VSGSVSNATVIGDPRPTPDECWKGGGTIITMSGTNVGDLLSARTVTWAGPRVASAPLAPTPNGITVCGSTHNNVGGATVADYIPHHEPSQYYSQTANPKHSLPASADDIGHARPAKHQYDLIDFWAADDSGKLAVDSQSGRR
jgi:phospholipase C